jgi:hypothetical protein
MCTDWIGWLIGLAGLVIGLAGLVVAFRQWHESRSQGERVYFFLHAAAAWKEITAEQKHKIHDIMQYLKPPKEKAAASPPPPAATDPS